MPESLMCLLIVVVACGAVVLPRFIIKHCLRRGAGAIIVVCLLSAVCLASTGCHARVHAHHDPARQVWKALRGR